MEELDVSVKESFALYQAALDASAQGIIVLSPAGDDWPEKADFSIRFANKAAHRQLHLEEGSLSEDLISEQFPFLAESGLLCHWQVIFEAKGGRMPFKSAEEDYFWTSAHAVRSGDYLVVSLPDAAKQLTEKQLRENQLFLSHITDQTPDMITVYDLETEKFVYTNRELTDTLGYSREELQKLSPDYHTLVANLVHPDDIKVLQERPAIVRKMKDGEIAEDIFRVQDHQGRWHWFRNRYIVFRRNPDGAVKDFLAISSDITQLKETEERLRESEQALNRLNDKLEDKIAERTAALRDSERRLREAQKLAKIGSWEYDPTTGNVSWPEESDLMKDFFEHDTDYDLGKVLTHFPDAERIIRIVDEALSNDRPYEIDTEFRLPNGKIRYVHTIGRYISGENGQVGKLYGTVMDITERKQTELALEASRKQLELVTDSIPACIAYIDDEHRYRFMNRTFEDWFGVDRQKMLGEGLWKFLGPKEYARAQEKLRIAFAGEEVSFDRIMNSRDGRKHNIMVRYKPDFSEDGKTVMGLVVLLVDVTDLKEAQKQIKENARRFQSFTDAMPYVVWETDPEGSVTFISKFWQDYTGRPVDAGLGDGWLQAVHPDDREQLNQAIGDAIPNGERFLSEFRFRAKTDEYRWFAAQGHPLKDAEGNTVSWFGSTIDVHDSKTLTEQLEKRVQERTAELARSNQDLEQFAYIASHDLKEPLRTISKFSEILDNKFGKNLGNEGQEYLAFVRDGSSRMQALVDDLLTYSRVGRGALQKEKVDLNKLLCIVTQNLQEKITESGATVDADQLPVVNGLQIQLQQLFQNLIGNGIKFHREGVPPKVRISAEKKEGQWLFKVQDNGIGIPEKDRERVFVIFQRLHGRDEYDGTGIGLSICKKIVEMHGGKIWVESEEGKGTTFVFTLG